MPNISKSEAIKRALEQLFAQSGAQASAWRLGKRFLGSDRRPGDVARHSKRLLRDLIRAR
jgi:hypothetical protein